MTDKSRCRVLVVEDEAVIAMLVEDMVLASGSEILGPVANLDEAQSLARNAALDAAILDINVAGAATFPVADILQERGIPFIFATGYGARAIPPPYRDTQTLPKPFSFQSLSDALRAALVDQPCHTEAA